MFPRYDHRAIEAHWQAVWQRTRLHEVDLDRAARPFYNLMMFPYPSAEGLHVGNVYAFTGADIYGRYRAMSGEDVFEPMGFDAFGIHSENFAIKQGVHPAQLTAHNVERFRHQQLERIGCRFAWDHSVLTNAPDYYRWTQWIFVQLFKAGLAVQKEAAVNWCPTDRTVLADEQVIDGRCERCDSPVEQRRLRQWFLRITAYAERLLGNLEHLDWSEKVKAIQRAWIGRSAGLEFELAVDGQPPTTISVFTTRPDTVFGMTYVVLAPEHPLVERLTTPARRAAVDDYVARARSKSDLERQQAAKTGVFIGRYAINPATDQRVPIWIADYVLGSYGTGAIMAVPAHDVRDWTFAQAQGLPIRPVIVPDDIPSPAAAAYVGHGRLVDSGPFSGLESAEAVEQIIAHFEAQRLGRRTVQYRLRDWLISRQRYWGPPIPIVHCPTDGSVPVPEEQLPVLLPETDAWLPDGSGVSPLARIPSFVETTCPQCGGPARRETDVMDNFLDSAWYFLRYPSAECADRPFDAERTRRWLPVDMYVGGAEHAVLHLLYSRFITMALHDLGCLAFDEPFRRFRAHGLLIKDGAKMSKSRGNVVNPDELIERFGADTLRVALMFLGPFDQGGEYADQGVGGAHRFLLRIWELVVRQQDRIGVGPPPLAARQRLHRLIAKVDHDVQRLAYNTAIAALMEYSHTLQRRETVHDEEVSALLRLLAPFAPHLAEALWAHLGKPYSIHQQPFPQAEAALLERPAVPVAVQLNGRTRGVLQLSPAASQAEAVEAAATLPAVRQQLPPDRALARVVYVPGRVLNLVTGPMTAEART